MTSVIQAILKAPESRGETLQKDSYTCKYGSMKTEKALARTQQELGKVIGKRELHHSRIYCK